MTFEPTGQSRFTFASAVMVKVLEPVAIVFEVAEKSTPTISPAEFTLVAPVPRENVMTSLKFFEINVILFSLLINLILLINEIKFQTVFK